jgi:peptidyl-prolyl cis-trans isomerase C
LGNPNPGPLTSHKAAHDKLNASSSSEVFKMKILTIPFLLSAVLYGQAAGQAPAPVQPPAPVNVTPGTPAVLPPGVPAPGTGAAKPVPVSPDTVVAEVAGKKYTAAEVDKMIDALPPQYQTAAHSQPQILSQVFLMKRLAEDAIKAGLDQRAPFKDQLEMSRIQVLSTAELSDINNAMDVSGEEQQKYYKDNPDKFKQVKVRVIYIAFNPNPKAPPPADGKKVVTEAEAKATIEDLAKQIQNGADFGKLARDLSDDKPSAAKDGDFGVVKQDSSYPQAIKTAVFALKQGELSAPIRQPGGFYLVRAEEIAQQPFNDAIMQIIQAVKQDKFKEWLKGMQAQYSVKIENPSYFSPRVPAQLQQVH